MGRVRARHQRGVTLIELLVAAIVLAVIAPALLTAQGVAFGGAHNAQRRTYALALAQGAIEAQRSKCADGTILLGTTEVTPRIGTTTYTVRTTVTRPSLIWKLAQLETIVSWPEERAGRTITDSLRLGTYQRTEAPL